MASADRILGILGLFTPARPAWSATEAAQALARADEVIG